MPAPWSRDPSRRHAPYMPTRWPPARGSLRVQAGRRACPAPPRSEAILLRPLGARVARVALRVLEPAVLHRDLHGGSRADVPRVPHEAASGVDDLDLLLFAGHRVADRCLLQLEEAWDADRRLRSRDVH